MEKKGSILVKLPMQLYVSLHDRQLNNHISFLVSRLLEEFLKATDVRISWVEMPSKAEQREYLERKLREFLSQTGQSTEAVKPPVQEKTEPTRVQEKPKQTDMPSEPPKPPVQSLPTYVQEEPKQIDMPTKPSKESPTPSKPESIKEDVDLDEEILRRIENLW
jgi:hypothetical protein